MFCIYVGPEDRVNGAKVHIIYIYSIISPIFFIPIFVGISQSNSPMRCGVGMGLMVWVELWVGVGMGMMVRVELWVGVGVGLMVRVEVWVVVGEGMIVRNGVWVGVV